MTDLLVAQISNGRESTVMRIMNSINMIDMEWFLMYPILITIAGVFAVGVPIEHGNVIIGQGVLETVVEMDFARRTATVGETGGIEAGIDLTMIMVEGDESRRCMMVMMCYVMSSFESSTVR